MISSSKPSFLKGGLTISVLATVMISAASVYMTTANAAPIYKIVDKKTGQVTFTDRPQSYEQQADKQVSQTSVSTGNSSSKSDSSKSDSSNSDSSSSSNTSSNNSTNGNAANNAQTATIPVAAVKAVQVNYQLTLIEPSEERAYRRPAQNVNVSVQIKPALQAGDSISIYFDDNEVAKGLNTSIATVDILPGEHSVQAVVKNKEGQVLQQVSRTIYVIQNNTTLQNNKKIAKQLLAYQNLPWHQKVMLKMRQKNTAKP
ncbi:DUF4124 domain-containing protein [Psychrobacter immobilis]|uniref:DUF4124 domain-containing protein n=1 Tax=Psychrobacter immobilis TaxID=498 RepID=UPI00191B1D79|nr:DUF4124 domain-containing protein [Psychrobacter immobilis]